MLKSITLRRSLLALALSTCATLASAATTFHIELNTLNLGSSGWIDLQFNPSPFDPVAATADLSHFVGFGDSSTAQWLEATGSIASGVRLSTANGPSDLIHEVNFGAGKVSFDVTIDSGAGFSGSAFAVALFDSQNQLVGAGDDGYNLLHLDWTPSATPGGNGSLVASGYSSNLVQITAVPEPSSWLMLGAGLALLGVARRRASAA